MSDTKTAKSQDFTYHAKNITIGDELKTDRNGKPYITGTFEHEKNGETKKIVFKAFDRDFPSGKSLTPATDMFNKLKDSREGYLTGTFRPGRETQDGKSFQDFHVAFAESVAERQAFVETQKAKKAKSSADLGAEIPF